MKDVTGLNVTGAKIFGVDVLPFSQLSSVSNLKALFAQFNFKNYEFGEDENKNATVVHAKNGEFNYKEQIFPIQYLTIEARRVIYSILADSVVAEEFYLKVYESLGVMDAEKRFKGHKPIIGTEVTTCIVNLDIDFEKIFSSKMKSFLKDKALKLCGKAVKKVADTKILLTSLSFDVHYENQDNTLKDNSVVLLTKKLTIEPRLGVDIKERRYFTSSPNDSSTHLKLLKEFENSLK